MDLPRPARRWIMTATVAAAAAMARPAPADVVASRAEADATGAWLTLTWPRPVTCRSTERPRELLLEFDRPLVLGDIDALPRQMHPWVRTAVQGYDTLLLGTAQDCRFDVTATGTTLRVRVRPLPTAGMETAVAGSPDIDAEVRVARDLFESGRLGPAIRSLERLRAARPSDAQAAAALAYYESLRGRWRRADGLYREAVRLDPTDAELRQDWRDLHAERAPQAGLSLVRDTDGDDIESLRAHADARWMPGDGVEAGGWADAIRLDADALQTDDGRDEPFHGERQWAGVFVRYTTERARWVRAEGFASAAGAGGHVSAGRWDNLGETSFLADYRRPYWEVSEGIAGDATRDRLALRRSLGWGSSLSAEIEGAWNRYGIGDYDSAAESVSVGGSLGLLVLTAPVEVRLEYALDAEFRQSAATCDPAGPGGGQGRGAGPLGDRDPCHPFDLQDREVHAAHATASIPIARCWQAECNVGWEWDRESGGDSPYASGSLVCGQGRWRAHAGYEHRRDFVDDRRRVSSMTAGIRVHLR